MIKAEGTSPVVHILVPVKSLAVEFLDKLEMFKRRFVKTSKRRVTVVYRRKDTSMDKKINVKLRYNLISLAMFPR